jgi:hypothetical protein
MRAPDVECIDNGDGTWKFWCQHCGRHHTHSAAPGHRAAHCHADSSPYRDTGYVLRLRSKD